MFRLKQTPFQLVCLLALSVFSTNNQAENTAGKSNSHNNASSFNNNASDSHVYKNRGKRSGSLSSHSNNTRPQQSHRPPRSYGNNADDPYLYQQRQRSADQYASPSRGHKGQHHSYGITGHPSFGLSPKPRHHKKQYHSNQRHYRDYGHDRYQPPRGLSYRGVNGILFYSATGYSSSNTATGSTIIRGYSNDNNRSDNRSGLTQSDAWDALGNYEIDTAQYAFESLIQHQPNAALPRVGFALSTALSGDVQTGAYAMEQALLSDIDGLRYFKADQNLQLIVEELLISYQTDPLMTASLLYFNQDYEAANQAVNIANNQCQQCTAVINLKALIHQYI